MAAMDEDQPLPGHKQPFSELLAALKEPQGAGAAGISALVASVAAALTGKVAQMTAGREGFEAMAEEMQRVANRSAQLAEKLGPAIDQDPQAQLRLNQAFLLPQATPDEAQIRLACLDLALKNAVQVPISIAGAALEVLTLAETVSRYGHPGAAAEAGLAMATAIAAVKGALASAMAALKGVTDEEWAEGVREQMAKILEQVMTLETELAEMPLTV